MKRVIFMACMALLLHAQAEAIKAAGYTEVNFKEVKRLYEAGSALFIDAREMKFYKKGTILGAIDMPIQKLKRRKRFLPAKKSAKLLLFCGGIKCGKSAKLATAIAKLGYSRILVYHGGYPEWKEKRQEIMLSTHYCRTSTAETAKPISVMDAKIVPGQDEGTVDTKWFAAHYKTGTLPGNMVLVDVRKAGDYLAGHLPHARSVVWDFDKGMIDSSQFPADKLTLLYCNTGMRSSDAYDSLDEETAKRVRFLKPVTQSTGWRARIAAHQNVTPTFAPQV